MLEIDHLGKTYGEGEGATEAIGDLSFELAEREFVCVVGPSGCGKTTLLKCMSGLLAPTKGEVRLHDRKVEGPPPEMALVFQEYSRSLLPWMSVRGNIELPLRNKKLPKEQRNRLVEDSVDAVALSGFIDRYPWELSGGMQQRVAIARALSFEPALLLMDEPFGALDSQTKMLLQAELLRLWEQDAKTVVFITHDIEEALFLGDVVYVMGAAPSNFKEIIQVPFGRPRDDALRADPEFAQLRERIWESLKSSIVHAETS
jgi:NitT/TauT family transport system ATP-binding protein